MKGKTTIWLSIEVRINTSTFRSVLSGIPQDDPSKATAEVGGPWSRWHCPDLVGIFLCRRSSRVKVWNILSSFYSVLAGVPQNTILEPLLFMHCVNDLSENLVSWHELYADYVKIHRLLLVPRPITTCYIRSRFHWKSSHSYDSSIYPLSNALFCI